eukprot:2717406-Prymnesium_polylepis.1
MLSLGQPRVQERGAGGEAVQGVTVHETDPRDKYARIHLYSVQIRFPDTIQIRCIRISIQSDRRPGVLYALKPYRPASTALGTPHKLPKRFFPIHFNDLTQNTPLITRGGACAATPGCRGSSSATAPYRHLAARRAARRTAAAPSRVRGRRRSLRRRRSLAGA